MRTAEEIERRISILMALHSVLLWEIPKKLRLASVEWDNRSSCVYFYFDGEIEERDKEALEIAHTIYLIIRFSLSLLQPLFLNSSFFNPMY